MCIRDSFQIDNNIISTMDSVKLLGVTIDKRLDFNEHVATLCKKAARQINALQRISKFIDYEGRLRIYESFITSNFEYCSTVYNNFVISQDRKMEKLNKRALKLVSNDYTKSYSQLLEDTGKEMLHVSRKVCLSELVYKIIHDMSPPIHLSLIHI